MSISYWSILFEWETDWFLLVDNEEAQNREITEKKTPSKWKKNDDGTISWHDNSFFSSTTGGEMGVWGWKHHFSISSRLPILIPSWDSQTLARAFWQMTSCISVWQLIGPVTLFSRVTDIESNSTWLIESSDDFAITMVTLICFLALMWLPGIGSFLNNDHFRLYLNLTHNTLL